MNEISFVRMGELTSYVVQGSMNTSSSPNLNPAAKRNCFFQSLQVSCEKAFVRKKWNCGRERKAGQHESVFWVKIQVLPT